ncbi:hypothetical protein ASAP_0919 [Asaia bogorensis]|uniref:Uncharacterized protein n=1 Tax=Asaia bogorensis TaxID=91915 RepID=A0A060QCT6_9PROT|nr:hypothetical protein ASAP_0919 [Asaia bogorensis]
MRASQDYCQAGTEKRLSTEHRNGFFGLFAGETLHAIKERKASLRYPFDPLPPAQVERKAVAFLY